jgi:hypothetical protein
MMMEAVRTSETSVDNHFTRQYNPEDNSEQTWEGYSHGQCLGQLAKIQTCSELRNAYKILVGNPQEKRLLEGQLEVYAKM